jgi:hypothetical protein
MINTSPNCMCAIFSTIHISIMSFSMFISLVNYWHQDGCEILYNDNFKKLVQIILHKLLFKNDFFYEDLH